MTSDLIIVNARITTLDRENPVAEAVAIRAGLFRAVGSEVEVRAASPDAVVIDAKGRRLVPADESLESVFSYLVGGS